MNALALIQLKILKAQRKVKALRAQFLKANEITG